MTPSETTSDSSLSDSDQDSENDERLTDEENLSALWMELHQFSLELWNPVAAAEWYYLEWLPKLPHLGCDDCTSDWYQLTQQYPPDFSSQERFFEWTVRRHNDINRKLGKPVLSIEEARASVAKG